MIPGSGLGPGASNEYYQIMHFCTNSRSSQNNSVQICRKTLGPRPRVTIAGFADHLHTRREGTGTFTPGFKQMIFFEGGLFQIRLSISRINSSVKWWGCGRRGHGDKGPVLACPGTNIKRSCIAFAVTSIALILGHIWANMLGRSAQSLIGSPCTLRGEWSR